MSTFNNIPKEGTWGQAADLLNANFAQADVTLESLKNATTRNKGYYSTSSVLRSTHPSGPDGSIAYVGTESPFAVWRYEAGWYDTGIKSVLEGADLTEYYTKAEINAKLDTLSLVVENDLAYVSIGGEKKGQGIEITGGGSGGDEGDDDTGGDTTESVNISGNSSLVEGDSTTFTATVSPTQSGVIWSITGGVSGDSISSSGKLTTTEYGSARTIVVKATTANGAYSTKSVSVQKAVRPSTVTISGKTSISATTLYTLTLAPSGINKSYSTTWSLSGTAYNSGHVTLSGTTSTTCTVVVNSQGTSDMAFTLKATVTSGSVSVTDSYTITLQKASSEPSTSGISTIRIDQTVTDPDGMITLVSNDNGEQINLIRQNSHLYLGKYTSEGTMTICQLSDSNSNYYNDGAAAVLTGSQGDVFMKLPHFWYKAQEETAGSGIWLIGFCYGNVAPDSSWKEWSGNELIGSYLASISGGRMYSVSGVSPKRSYALTNFETDARARGTGYTPIKWKHHCMMAFLFFAYYRTTNSQAVCGAGANAASTTLQNGQCNANGMTDTTYSMDAINPIKFWGLENWWGYCDEVMLDARVSVSNNETAWTIGDRTLTTEAFATGTSDEYISKLLIGDELDAIPIAGATGSATSGYCDGTRVLTNEMVFATRGHYNYVYVYGGAGITAIHTIMSLKADSYTGSRLAFSGTITEVQSSSTFKNLSAIN